VVGQRLPKVGQAIGIERFDRLGDPVVEALAAPRRELAVGDFADSIVGEVETLAHAGEEASSNELLHSLRGRVVIETGGLSQKLELELAPDPGGHGQQGPAPGGQPLEPAADHLADTLRQRHTVRRGAFLERAHRLHDHEGIPFAGDPDLLTEPFDGCRVAGAHEHSHKGDGVGLREWREPQRRQLPGLDEIM